MTPRRDTRASSGQGSPQTVEQLQARIAELEQELRSRPSSVRAGSAGAPQSVQPMVIAVLGGAVLITTPLAALTVKRWWRWWTE